MLPPAVQTYAIQAGEYLAGLDNMIARTEQLAGSLDGSIAGTDAMSAAIDAQAAAYARAVEAAGLYIDAQGRLREANGRFASSAAIAGVEADAEAAGWDRAAVSADRAGESAVVAGDRTEVAGGKAAGFGSLMKTAFLGVGIAAIYGVAQASKFQAAMEQLHTQAGVAQSKIAGLSQQVLQLSGQVGEGPQSLAESLYHVASNMASLGATGPTMLNAVKVAAQGAQVGGANLVDVTNALTAAIASGIPGVQNFSQAMGALNATVGSGDMHMQDLAEAFSTGLLATVKGYGLSLKDVGAALAVFGDNNIRGAKAGTDLRMAVQALAVPVSAGGKLLKSWGMTTDQLAKDMSSGGLMKALNDLTAHFKTNGITAKNEGEVITTLFGKKAGSGIAVLLEQMDRLKSKYPDITKSANNFGDAWTQRQKTMAQQWHDLVAGSQALAISFGQLLLPAATKIVGQLARFATFLEKHQAIAAFAGGILALAGAFKIALSAVSLFKDGIGLMTNPAFLVIAAIAGLALGLYELYKHSKLVRDIVADVGHFFKAVWADAMRAAGAVIKWFENGPLKDIEKAIAFFKSWWKQNGAEVEQIWKGVWGVIKAVFETYWKILSTEIKLGLDILRIMWRIAWGAVKDSFLWAWNVIKAEVTTAVHIVMDVISIFLDIVTGHWSKAWHDIQKLFHDAVNGIENIAKAWAGGFVRFFEDLGRNVIQGFINGIKSMFGAVGSVVSSLGHGALGVLTSVFHMASPSRATYRIGVLVAQGLADGLLANPNPATAARTVASDLLAAVKEAASRGVISVTRGSDLSAWLTADNQRLSALAAQRATIAKTIAAAQKYAQTTTSNTEQAFGLMAAAGNAPMSALDIVGALRADVTQIRAFKANIQKLAKMGLNKAYIDQLIQAGPVQGGQVAQELASGSWADIKAINSAESQIAAASTSLGKTAAEAMYDSGRNAGKGFLSGLEAQQAAITKMMQKLAEAMVSTIKRDLGIGSPSRVFMEHGKAIIDGLVLGVEGGTGRVSAAMRGVSAATAMPYGGGLTAGYGGGAAPVHINITVNGGLVGSQSQIAEELYRLVQQGSLRSNHRNPTNGLSLAFGR